MTLPFFRRQQISSRKAHAKRARLRPSPFRIEPIVQLEERAVPATFTWDGGGDGVSWNSSANWFNVTTATDDDNFPAVAGDVANLTFDWATAPTINLNQAIAIGGLVIEDTGATGDVPVALNANGGSLTFDNSSSGATINMPAADALLVNQIASDITLADSLTVTTNSNANFQLAGVTNGGNLLTIAGSGDTAITGVIGNGAGGLTKTGAGTLTLSGLNTYTGVTTISQGTVVANKIVVSGGNSNLGNAASAVILGDATNQGTLSYTGNSAAYTRGFTINTGGGRIDTTTSGQTLTISTAGIALGGPGIIGGAGSTTISSTITGGGSLTKNDAGTLTLSNSNTFSGGFDLNAGRAVVTASTALPTNGQFGVGAITLSGGELFNNTANLTTQNNITIDGDAAITFGTASSPTSSNIDWFLSGTVTYASGLSLLTINSPRTSDRDAAVRFTGDQNINTSFSVTGTLGGNSTEANSVFFGAVGKNINFSADRQITVNTPTLTFGTQVTTTVLAGTLVGGANKLTIAGTTGRFGLGQLTGSSGGIILNGPGTVTTTTASEFAGGVTLQSGNLSLSGNSTGTPVTSGPVGTGILTLSGGKLLNGAGATLTLGNAITVNGDATIEQTQTGSGRLYTLSGDVTFASGLATLTVNTIGNQSGNHISLSGNINVNTSFAIQGTLTSDNNLVLGGTGKTITWAAARQITLSNTLGTGNNIFRGALAGTVGALTIAGTTRATWGDSTTAISGSSTSGVIFDGPIITASGTSTYSGGTTLNSGTLRYGTSTTGAVTNGPFGTGTLTLAGGTLQGTASATIANALTVTGSATIDRNDNNATNTFSGALTINAGGSLTFRNTGNTSNSPAFSFTGATQTVNAAATFTSFRGSSNATNVSFNALTWNGNAVTFKGDSTFTLSNSASAGSGAVNVGETNGSGSAGGNLALFGANGAAVQNALGTGDLTINYGGRFSYNDSFATLTNKITVNTGGSIVIGNTASTVATGTTFSTATGSELKSGATIVNNQGNSKTLQLTSGTGAGQVALPSAGALFFGTNNNVGLTLAQGSGYTLTGTMAFGGTLSGGNNTIGTAASVISADRTIAFNTNGASSVIFNGLSLSGGNLTVAGTGNTGLTGLVPTGAAANLGTISGAGSNIAVAMAPAAMVSLTGNATTWVDTNLNSGTLLVNTTNGLGSGTATLNGGVLRLGTTISKDLSVSANSGAIEAANQTYSGALSGSTNLVVRGVGGNLTLSGTNTGFTGGFTVATAGTPGTVFFTGTNALGGSGAIAVGKGLAFGGTAVNTGSYANAGRFSTADIDSVYNVSNNDGAPNLSNTGLNRDVWVGLSGTNITGYTLPSSGANTANYRIVPISGTTVSSANVFTGSNNLIVSTGAVPTDSNSSATNVLGAGITLTISGAQDYSGSTTVQGTARNSLMGGGLVVPTLVAQSSLSTSSVLVDKGGVLTLSTANGILIQNTGARSITVTGGGTFNDGLAGTSVANRIDTGFALNLGGTNGGGTFNVVNAATVDQALASLAVNAGSNVIGLTNATLTFASPTVTRAVGGALTLPAVGVTLTGASATNVLGGWAFVGTNFAAVNGSAQVVASAPGTNDINTANGDFQNTNSGVYTLTSGPRTVNSINLNTATNAISTATFGLTVVSGGIIRTQNVPINTGTGGTLTSSYTPTTGVRELILNDTIAGGNNGSGANIAPQIVQHDSINITLTKLGGGNPVLTNSSNQIGDIYAYGGRLEASAIGGLGQVATTRTLNLHGGSIHFAHAGANYANTSVVVGPLGGGLNGVGSAASPVIVGSSAAPITLNGLLALKNSNAATFLTLAGDITGPGAIEFNARGSGANSGMTLELTGDNSAWSGGVQTGANNGAGTSASVRFAKGTSSGTGPINPVGPSGAVTVNSLYFDTASATDSNYVNDIRIPNTIPLVVVSQGPGLSSSRFGATSATFSGRLISTVGLTLQGYATANDAVSEMILAGPITISGTNAGTNYGTTTAIQNFNNGQGGITLGTIGAVTLPSGTANNGAEGFVRFNGTNSFIPGAVGPGYLSAVRKASGGGDGRFGYLLTGTVSGTTYTLPEGKSFVIGSLGAGTQQFGTLGVASDNAAAESATLLGGAKAAAGQLLAGFSGGDINIHANAASDSQSLNLFARAADDTLTLGSSAVAENVVFTPTYGDSGLTSTITLMQKRTGATTLNKIGAGTLNVQGVSFTNTDGTDARGGFTWNVNAGTLRYNNVDSGAAFAGFNVNTGGTLGGSGVIIGNVVVASGATLAPGNSIGALGVSGSLQLSGLNDFEVTGGSSSADQVNGVTALTYGGTLKITGSGFLANDSWDLFNFTSQTGSFANNSVFGTSGDGTNLPTLSGGLQWQFNYATGVLSVVQSLAAPTVTSIVPAIGPTTGGTLVVINGSNFVSITSVTVGTTVFDNTSFTVSGTTQITLTTPAHAAGTVDVVVTNAGGAGTLGGGNDFTYAAPAIASVVVNGGPGVVLGGSTWSLAGQNSVVKQILVTFNQAVTLASDAFTVTPVPVSVTPGPGVVIVNGGAAPSSAAVTASIAATLSPSSYLVTFSGPGTHAGGGINSGVYDLTTIASKVSANSETMASNRVDTFFAMFGTINANDSLTAGTIGDGFSNAFVDPGSLFQFSDAFGSNAATPVGPPAYNVVFDSNLDGFIDPGDLFAFSDSFGIDWDF